MIRLESGGGGGGERISILELFFETFKRARRKPSAEVLAVPSPSFWVVMMIE